MNIEWVRRHCMSFRHATETVQWGNDLVFKVGGKMFAVVALEPMKVWLSLKCSPEKFTELVERPGVIPAPYLARSSWVALENADALSHDEIKALLKESYRLVVEKLSQTTRAKFKLN